MKKCVFFILFFGILAAGCLGRDWIARYYAMRAEDALTRASNLKRSPFEKRLHFFVEACRDFGKSYEIDREVFTLTRIEVAQDACWKAGDHEAEEKFRQFEEEYSKSHPQEARYGDAGVGMIQMD